MRAIMNSASRDMFKHIAGSKGREYLIKMSAIEIYNEVVHDLLDESKTNLKIQDDPERGPVVDGLSDEPVKSEAHLERLIGTVDKRRYVSMAPFQVVAGIKEHQHACAHAAWYACAPLPCMTICKAQHVV